jgi:hypothetical protein
VIRIIETRRLGLTVYIATIVVDGHCHLQSTHMSEGGARAWVARRLAELGRGARAA